MTVRIVTDSACDLTDEEASSLGIDIVPLSIRFGDQQFLDREELSVDDFYRRMAASDDLPQTAAPATLHQLSPSQSLNQKQTTISVAK